MFVSECIHVCDVHGNGADSPQVFWGSNDDDDSELGENL